MRQSMAPQGRGHKEKAKAGAVAAETVGAITEDSRSTLQMLANRAIRRAGGETDCP